MPPSHEPKSSIPHTLTILPNIFPLAHLEKHHHCIASRCARNSALTLAWYLAYSATVSQKSVSSVSKNRLRPIRPGCGSALSFSSSSPFFSSGKYSSSLSQSLSSPISFPSSSTSTSTTSTSCCVITFSHKCSPSSFLSTNPSSAISKYHVCSGISLLIPSLITNSWSCNSLFPGCAPYPSHCNRPIRFGGTPRIGRCL